MVKAARTLKYGVRHPFRCWPAVGGIVLDAKVFIRPAGIVTGRQDKPSKGLLCTDYVAGGRRG